MFPKIFSTRTGTYTILRRFLASLGSWIPVLKNYLPDIRHKHTTFSNLKGLQSIASLVATVEETPQPISAKIQGHFPKWLEGCLIRIGPGKFEFGKEKYNHWFDGMALLHQFRMEKGNVTYRSKFLQSDTYMTNSIYNRIVVSEFGTLALPDPCKNVFERFMSKFESSKITDNTNVSCVRYKGDYYISTETTYMNKVDPETLEKTEKVDWGEFIAVNGATAHPHYDPDGTAYNMGNSYGPHGSCYNVIQVPPQKVDPEETIHGARVICSIPCDQKMKPSYYHSFEMTKNYIIFVEQPLKMNLWKIITSKIRGKPFMDGISWEPQYNTKFLVVDKHTGQLLPEVFYSKPFLYFHQINAFEDEGCITLDLCCQDDGRVLDAYQLQNLRKAGEGLDQIWCSHENLHHKDLEEEGGLEFPQINYTQYNSRKYRFFYGCGFRHLVGDSLIKVDVVTKKLKVWRKDGFLSLRACFCSNTRSQ